jgi:hypothetical protein
LPPRSDLDFWGKRPKLAVRLLRVRPVTRRREPYGTIYQEIPWHIQAYTGLRQPRRAGFWVA